MNYAYKGYDVGKDNVLTNGVHQKEAPINGDWNTLKKDTNNLITSIENSIEDVIDSDNEKVKGYKSSLNYLLGNLKNFKGKIDTKSGIVKSDDDDYTDFLENRYYLEKEKSELSVLCSTVNVLKMTEEL